MEKNYMAAGYLVAMTLLSLALKGCIFTDAKRQIDQVASPSPLEPASTPTPEPTPRFIDPTPTPTPAPRPIEETYVVLGQQYDNQFKETEQEPRILHYVYPRTKCETLGIYNDGQWHKVSQGASGFYSLTRVLASFTDQNDLDQWLRENGIRPFRRDH